MTDRYEVICQACRKPVANKTGYIWIDEWKVNKATSHGEVNWRAHHKACDPDIEADSYTIEVERIRTKDELLDWSAHLMGKRWISLTNWHVVMDGAAHGYGILRRAIDPWKHGTPGYEEF